MYVECSQFREYLLERKMGSFNDSGITEIQKFDVGLPGTSCYFSLAKPWGEPGDDQKRLLVWFYGLRENISLEALEAARLELPEGVRPNLRLGCWEVKEDVIKRICEGLRKTFADSIKYHGEDWAKQWLERLKSDQTQRGGRTWHFLQDQTGSGKVVADLIGDDEFQKRWYETVEELTRPT